MYVLVYLYVDSNVYCNKCEIIDNEDTLRKRVKEIQLVNVHDRNSNIRTEILHVFEEFFDQKWRYTLSKDELEEYSNKLKDEEANKQVEWKTEQAREKEEEERIMYLSLRKKYEPELSSSN